MIGVSGVVAARGAAAGGSVVPAGAVSNIEELGHVLYTRYVYLFEAAGLVLTVAMIGAIVLTLRIKPGVKRQNIADQTARDRKSGLRIVQVKIGEGVSE
jgi:NADH-quinone oxidoreductase subunit J